MTASIQSTAMRLFVAFIVVMISACASVDRADDSSRSKNLSYEGEWLAKVTKYNREQLSTAHAPYAGTRWTCRDGKPFQFRISVKEGMVRVKDGKPMKVAKLSSRSSFKAVSTKGQVYSSIITGNFEKKKGKLQSRKNGLDGCRFKFDLEKQ